MLVYATFHSGLHGLPSYRNPECKGLKCHFFSPSSFFWHWTVWYWSEPPPCGHQMLPRPGPKGAGEPSQLSVAPSHQPSIIYLLGPASIYYHTHFNKSTVQKIKLEMCPWDMDAPPPSRYCQLCINRELSLTKGNNSWRHKAIWAILKLEHIMVLKNVTKFHRIIIKTRNVSIGHGCPRYCQICINRELSLTKGNNSWRHDAI